MIECVKGKIRFAVTALRTQINLEFHDQDDNTVLIIDDWWPEKKRWARLFEDAMLAYTGELRVSRDMLVQVNYQNGIYVVTAHRSTTTPDVTVEMNQEQVDHLLTAMLEGSDQ